jgi:hypothetical protein
MYSRVSIAGGVTCRALMMLFSGRQPKACATASPPTRCSYVHCHALDIEVVANSKPDKLIVLKRLVIDVQGGHYWQHIEPFAAWVDGKAVQESAVAIAWFAIEHQHAWHAWRVTGSEQPLGSDACSALCVDDFKGSKFGVAVMRVGPGSARSAVGGSKGAQLTGEPLQCVHWGRRRMGSRGQCGSARVQNLRQAVRGAVRGSQRLGSGHPLLRYRYRWYAQILQSSASKVAGVFVKGSGELPGCSPGKML